MKKKTMQEALKESYTKERMKQDEFKKRIKREEKKEKILTFLIGSFIVIITLLLMTKVNDNYMSDCVSAGYSVEYCERGM